MNFHIVDMKERHIYRWTALGKDYTTWYIAPIIQNPERIFFCEMRVRCFSEAGFLPWKYEEKREQYEPDYHLICPITYKRK